MAGPTLRRRRLAATLRRLREQAGMTAADVVKEVGVSKSTLSRLENALVPASVPTATTLLRLYGLTPEEIDALAQVARDARQRGWWRRYSDVLPEWFEPYIGLESDACEVHGYEPALVPGLLQTPAYAEAVLRAANPDTSDEALTRRVELRMRRQQRDDDPRLWFVLDQAVLRRPVGGAEVWRTQLDRLLTAGRRPGITLQVLPESSGEHGSMGVAWTELLFDSDEDPPLVYLENYTSSLYLEEAAEVAQYERLFDHLRAAALPPRESLARIAEAVDGTLNRKEGGMPGSTDIHAHWRKATRSGGSGGNCVEVAIDNVIGVRDTKDRRGPILEFAPEEWASFTSAVKAGRLHH